MNKLVDCVIVGGGIAGLSTALFLGRASCSAVLFDVGKSRILSVDTVREYLGHDGQNSAELLADAKTEVEKYGVRFVNELVESIRPREDGYFDVSSATQTLIAKTIVLATGVVDQLPPLTGLRKAWGNDIRVCPCFDGFEVRDKKYVVFGLHERLAHMSSWVWMWSKDVTVVTEQPFSSDDAQKLSALNIDVKVDKVTGLKYIGDKFVGLETASGNVLACDAAWIAAWEKATSTLAETLCDVDERGIAIIDANCITSRAGVFAVGNAADPWAHIAQSASMGSTAGPVVVNYLLDKVIESKINEFV